jgi:hypothetical protein
MNPAVTGHDLLMNRRSGGAVSKRSGVMETFAKKRPEAIAPATQLSEVDLNQAVGGFNPQPDPPGDVMGKARVTPSDFAIRARQIAG